MTVQTSTELKQAIAEARGLLSRIHHDVNNPLSVLSGNVELLQELVVALGMEDELSEPLVDMQAAVHGLGDSIDRLMVVRRLLSELESKVD